MAGLALSSIGVIFGWGKGTTSTAPTTFKQIEECKQIGSASKSKETIDATPLESISKKYVGGHADTGGSLNTTFNASDVFENQWAELMTEYKSLSGNEAIWFCAYHPSKTKMNVYIVEPGEIPAPEYTVGSVLEYSIENVLIDLPEPITAKKPTANAIQS